MCIRVVPVMAGDKRLQTCALMVPSVGDVGGVSQRIRVCIYVYIIYIHG